MTEDVRELVRQAGLQPDEPAPVDAIVERARRRTVRRRVAYAVAPVLVGLVALVVVPVLWQHRVQFPPAAPDGKGAMTGWHDRRTRSSTGFLPSRLTGTATHQRQGEPPTGPTQPTSTGP